MTSTTYQPPTSPASDTTPIIDEDPFGHEILTEPYDFHRNLREIGPVAFLPQYGIYAMGRYAEVHAALTDWQSFQSSAGVGYANFRYEEPWRPPSVLLESDPPVHDAPRRVLSSILSPQALRRLRPHWVADAQQLVNDLPEGELDGVADIARKYPLRIFPDAVGIGPDNRENLLTFGDLGFNTFGPPNDLIRNAAEIFPPLAKWIHANTAREVLASTVYQDEPTFGALIWAAADRGDIPAEHAPLVVRALLSAGVDTTVTGIAAALLCFAQNPDQWQRIRENPALIRVAFDEAVRRESPVQVFFRTASRPVMVGDDLIPEGVKVLLFLGSANRDPRKWDDPDRFDVGRDPSGHVGFGMGVHQCAGQHVARLEAEAILTSLSRRFSRIELTGTPTRHLNNTLRVLETLPIRLTE